MSVYMSKSVYEHVCVYMCKSVRMHTYIPVLDLLNGCSGASKAPGTVPCGERSLHKSPAALLLAPYRAVFQQQGPKAQGAPRSPANMRQEEQLVPNPPSQAPHTPAAVQSTASDQSALSQH